MKNNLVLRRLRYALDLSDSNLRRTFAVGGRCVDEPTLAGYLRLEEEPGYLPCEDEALDSFLDGLIIERRGQREAPAGREATARPRLDNNGILRKLRIALELTEDDLLDMLRAAEFRISRSELSALFRRKGHPNYRPCGSQLLRNVLTGLTRRHRGSPASPPGGDAP